MSHAAGPPGGGLNDHRSGTSPVQLDVPLRVLQNGLPDHGIFVVSRSGMVLTWNSGAKLVHGYQAEEIIGQHVEILFPPGSVDRQESSGRLEHARGRGGLQWEGWQQRKDGRLFWASQLLIPLHDRLGRLHGFGVVTRVLTDRMRAQDLLAILDAATDAVLGVDSGGLIMLANDAAAGLFGYTKRELIGRRIEVLVPARHRETHAALRADYHRKPVPRPMGGGMALTAVRRDGTEFPVEVSLSSVQTPRGQVVTALVRDLSTDPSAAARERVEEGLRALFEYSPAGQAEVASDGRVLRANRALEDLLGYSRGELTGARWRALVNAADPAVPDTWLDAPMGSESARAAQDAELIHRSGRPVPVVLSMALAPDRPGTARRAIWAALERRPAAQKPESAARRP